MNNTLTNQYSQPATILRETSMKRTINKKILSRAIAGALVLSALGASMSAQAIEFTNGELSGSFDTTVSYGASWRMEERDPSNVGKSFFNPLVGTLPNAQQRAATGRFSVNGDDGNLNYDDGDLVAHSFKITSELGMQWRNFGAFFRANYFFDFENHDNERLTELARDEFVGDEFRLLDAYVYGDFEVGDSFLSVRLGRQVVSWGESTFIQGGINVVNPVDVSKLRIAGAELKEAFLPIEQIWASIDLSENVSVEALYMFEFEQIDPDPAGTYFSTNDFGTPGGQFAMLGFGVVPQPVMNPDFFVETCLNGNLGASDLNPLIAGAGCGFAFPRAESRFAKESGQYGLALRWFAPALNDTEFGFYYLNYHSRLPLISGTAITSSVLTSGRYFTEYPEDIELFGVSFNTTLPGGWALQGEYSYRDNLPLQIDDVEVLFSGLSPLNPLIEAPANRFISQLGEFAPGQEIQGWERHEAEQLQFTFTKLFGPNNPFGAQEWVVLGEIGASYFGDLPDQSVLRYNGPGTDTGGGPDVLSGQLRNPQTQVGGFADDFSWGYRLITRLDYNSAFGTAWTVSPRIGFNHDVDGTSPGPGGNFIDGRRSTTIGVSFNYLQKWIGDIAYTSFSGAGNFNELRDRDFLSASVRYSF